MDASRGRGIQYKSRLAQRQDGGLKIVRPWGGGSDRFTGTRMFEAERIGMKHLARGGVVRLRAKPNVLAPAVGAIASQRKTKMLKVNADLVSASGMEDDLDERGGAKSFKHAKAGACFAAFARFGYGHGAAMGGMSGDGGLDFTGSFRKFAAEDRVINFFQGAIAELLGKAEMRGVIFGDHQTTARILVDAMDDARPRVAGDAAELAGAVV